MTGVDRSFAEACLAAGWGACLVCGWFGRRQDQQHHYRTHATDAVCHGMRTGVAQPSCRAVVGAEREPCTIRAGHPAHRACWKHGPTPDGRPAYPRSVRL